MVLFLAGAGLLIGSQAFCACDCDCDSDPHAASIDETGHYEAPQ